MSGMLRANKTGGSAGKRFRHVRSFSVGDESSSGYEEVGGGARLSVAGSLSPPRVRFSPITEEFSRINIGGSSEGSDETERNTLTTTTGAAGFQLGDKPDGEIFKGEGPIMAPLKSVLKNGTLKNGHNLTEEALTTLDENNVTDEERHMTFDERTITADDCRMTRSVTAPGMLSMANSADRAYRAPGARNEFGTPSAQFGTPSAQFGTSSAQFGTPSARRELRTPSSRQMMRTSGRNEIGGIDAQGIYPPSACVFVANLPEGKDDRALEAAVTREFSRFGTVFVKIRREGRGNVMGMPYAFAQYTNDNDAQAAVQEGKGIMILGRPCRTEMVKANRTFVIYSRNGDDITTDVARGILEPYGDLSKCEVLPVQVQEAMRLPMAVLVEFAKFDPKRDLNSAVRQYDGFCIDAFDVKKKTFMSRADADKEFMDKYDQDRHCIFVGGLPYDANKEEVAEFFSSIGEVVDVNIVTRSYWVGNVRAFGFVKFIRADLPDVAVEKLHNASFRGYSLRVQRKSCKHAGTPHRVRSQAFVHSSATPQTPRDAAPARSPMAASGAARSSAARSGASRLSTGRREALLRAPPPAFVLPAPPAQQGGYTIPVPVPPMEPIPPVGANGQPVLGASGLPVTPSASTPFLGPNGYSFAGGLWQGVTMFRDPATGQEYWSCTPPVGSINGGPPAQTPTRGHEHYHYHG